MNAPLTDDQRIMRRWVWTFLGALAAWLLIFALFVSIATP